MADSDVIGTVLATCTFPVERGKIREFATAVLAEDLQEYFDPDTPGGIVAPPTFTQVLAIWGGSSSLDIPGLDIDMWRIVHGEQEMEFFEPVRAGDILTATSTVGDVYTKTNSRGQEMRFIVLEVRFANQHGRDVVRSAMTLIETPAAEAAS